MTDNNREIWQQIKDRLDDFWSLGPNTDEKASDAASDAFWEVADDDIHWLLERVEKLETVLARYKEEEAPVGGVHFGEGKVHFQNAFHMPPVIMRNIFGKEGE